MLRPIAPAVANASGRSRPQLHSEPILDVSVSTDERLTKLKTDANATASGRKLANK